MRCTCIAYITIDFVIRMEKKNYPQGYLEEWKYNVQKKKKSKRLDSSTLN